MLQMKRASITLILLGLILHPVYNPSARAQTGGATSEVPPLESSWTIGRDTSDEERASEEATRIWLAANAIRLNTVEAGHGFADMQPLKQVIGKARIVALGEATHGTREFFQLKHRMLEFLVSEMGFNLFAIEATLPESFDINEYVLTGKGDPRKALAGIYFWTWDTEEVLEMIEWMRRYNADPRHTRKVKFYGFDMQSAPRAAKVTLAYLHRVDPQEAGDAERELTDLANPYTDAGFSRQPKEKKDAALATLKEVLDGFDRRKQDYIKRSSAEEWVLARQHAQVLAQNLEMRSGDFLSPAQLSVRDRSMAENIRWILDREGPNAKAVVWAHNGHVATGNQGGVERMGLHLRRMFGADLVVFGFAFNQGGFQAMEMPLPSERGLVPFNVAPAPEGNLDAMLASAGLQVAAIDLRGLPRDGLVAKWFNEPRGTRSIGAAYDEQFASSFFQIVTAAKSYDALLFVQKTTPARPVVQSDGLGPMKKLPAPANTDFEKGEAGAPPPDWQVRTKLRRYDFKIETSEDRPYSGKRCGSISRSPGKHYGEAVGSLDQRLDATAYRGKKIRLRAMARANIIGAGNLSWIRLNISRDKLDPQEGIIFDSLDKYPVTSNDWRMYEITADVPPDADGISYGLFLVGDGKAWLDSVALEVIDK